MSRFSRMNVLFVLLGILVVQHTLATAVGHSDPSNCQRVIKYMLITACGATKREFRTSPKFKVMTEEEIEKQYTYMVKSNMIKGVGKEKSVENNNWDWDTMNDLKEADNNEIHHKYKPHHQRFKRSVIGIRKPMKTLVDAPEHDKKGSFHFLSRMHHGMRDDREDRSPPPGELKAKCCGGVILCTMDDFRGFCE